MNLKNLCPGRKNKMFMDKIFVQFPLVLAVVFMMLFQTSLNKAYGQDDDTAKARLDTLMNMDLEDLFKVELLDIKILSGAKGGFGKQLEELQLKAYLHGYTATWYRTCDLNRRKKNQTFSVQYFNPILGVNVDEKVIAEIMLEYEHGSSEIGMRYGILDYTPFKFTTIRIGQFLMPVGRFNEYIYPEYINLLNDRPLPLWHIIPSVWTEIGAQLKGGFPLSAKASLNYSLFVVNGLEQKDGKHGGDIRGMRNNYRDYSNDEKSYGGRLGLIPVTGLELGGSYYTGAFTTDGKHNLSILCIDAEYKTRKFLVRGEAVRAVQDTTSGFIVKEGFFIETSYKINSYLEPVIRYDQATVPNVAGFDGIINTQAIERVTAGLIIYPEPKRISRFSFKINYSQILNDGNGKVNNEFVLQTALGF